MYLLKGCSRCKGDLCPQEDMYGAYLRCLQCGRITEQATLVSGVSANRTRTSRKQAA